jgi:ribonuclease T
MSNPPPTESATNEPHLASLATRFRGFLPVVIDIETGGFDAQKDAILEIAAVLLKVDEQGGFSKSETHHFHIEPFPGANLNPAALAFTGIDPYHPFRDAVPEEEAFIRIFQPIRHAIRDQGCNRAVLVAHNAFFDHEFIKAAVARNRIKRNPFHPFTCFDTATLAALALGQTVLAKACLQAQIPFDQHEAHSALYDAERTAELFCHILNTWQRLGGMQGTWP